jgi:Putative peptidoglycan binding domain
MNCMRFTTSLVAGLLVTGLLAIAPDTSFARGGGGGGGHFGGGGGGGHFGGFHGGFASHGFAQGGHADAAWHHGGGWSHHGYGGYYGYYGPFDYGLDDYYGYTYPYYENDKSFDLQTADIAPQESTARTMSVQKELTQLGYYHGPIDGIVGSETEHAIRWFQSVDKLPITGRIDSATLQALRIG